MPQSVQKEQKPLRYRKARKDASIAKIQKAIEEEYGLPSGSVRFVNPDGKTLRRDALVGRLLRNWREE